MLSLQETLASQSDLEKLCADRPLRTREAFAPNSYYGIARILKQYAGLPHNLSLKAVVPHGIVFDVDFVWEAEVRALVPAVFCWPPYRELAYASLAGKRVFLSAAPFLYVVEMLKSQPQPDRQGTIFFPHHSTHYVTAETDFDRLAQEVAHLDSEVQPVTVCMYWRDFNLGHHLPFAKRGLRIVSAGHMYDPDFLFRFYHLCSMHHYASANGLGSNLFYSVKAGCSFFHLDGTGSRPLAGDHVLQRDVSRTPGSTESSLKALFSSRRPSPTMEQLLAVDYYLGSDHLRLPRALLRLLLLAELLDKVGFQAQGREAGTRLAVPTYYRRSGRMLQRGLQKAGRKLWKFRDSVKASR